MSEWIRTNHQLPEDGTVVQTKIDDYRGMRNEQPLKRQGRLWFYPDGSMYVYYHANALDAAHAALYWGDGRVSRKIGAACFQIGKTNPEVLLS